MEYIWECTLHINRLLPYCITPLILGWARRESRGWKSTASRARDRLDPAWWLMDMSRQTLHILPKHVGRVEFPRDCVKCLEGLFCSQTRISDDPNRIYPLFGVKGCNIILFDTSGPLTVLVMGTWGQCDRESSSAEVIRGWGILRQTGIFYCTKRFCLLTVRFPGRTSLPWPLMLSIYIRNRWNRKEYQLNVHWPEKYMDSVAKVLRGFETWDLASTIRTCFRFLTNQGQLRYSWYL